MIERLCEELLGEDKKRVLYSLHVAFKQAICHFIGWHSGMIHIHLSELLAWSAHLHQESSL